MNVLLKVGGSDTAIQHTYRYRSEILFVYLFIYLFVYLYVTAF